MLFIILRIGFVDRLSMLAGKPDGFFTGTCRSNVPPCLIFRLSIVRVCLHSISSYIGEEAGGGLGLEYLITDLAVEAVVRLAVVLIEMEQRLCVGG